MPFTLTINGEAVTPAETFPVLNPATEEVYADCPKATAEHLEAAVAAAKQAFKSWSRTTREERNKLILKLGEALEENADEMASIITQEQGKPLHNAKEQEAMASAMWCKAITEYDLPVEVLEDNERFRSELHHRPLGVVGGISPWNYPLNTATWKMLPAIATGNTVVLKPSPYTPLATLKLGELARDIFPPGVVNVIAGGDELGQMMSEHPDIAKITMTGSIATGKKIMSSAGKSNLKRVTLELGGNDPAIVTSDVDIAAIAQSLFWFSFINTGQVCIAVKRIYAHEDIYDDLCKALTDIAQHITLGDGMQEGTMLGPLQNKMQYDRVIELAEDSKAVGGKFLCGGDKLDGKGYFFPVSIVTGLNDSHRLVAEEQFGPLLPILKYSDIDDAIARCNESNFGLGASVWCRDIDAAQNIAAQLESGTVWINHHMAKKPNAPFGGMKESGIGVENTARGLAQFTQPQVIGVAKESFSLG